MRICVPPWRSSVDLIHSRRRRRRDVDSLVSDGARRRLSALDNRTLSFFPSYATISLFPVLPPPLPPPGNLLSSRYEITALLVGPTWMAGSEIERGLKGASKEVHEMALLHPFVRRPFRVANCCGWHGGASDPTLTRLVLLKFFRVTRTMVIRWFRSFASRSRPLRVFCGEIAKPKRARSMKALIFAESDEEKQVAARLYQLTLSIRLTFYRLLRFTSALLES